MNRWISSLLTCALALSLLTGEIAPALAEDAPEIISEAAEPDVALADAVDAEGLTVEIGEIEIPEAPEDEPEAAAMAEEPAPAAPAARYAIADEADVLDAADGVAFARLAAGSAVLVAEEAGSLSKIAFDTASGVVVGYVAADRLSPLNDAEAAGLVNAIAASGALTLYNDDLNMPLPVAECAFIRAGADETPETEEDTGAEDIPEAEEIPETEAEEDLVLEIAANDAVSAEEETDDAQANEAADEGKIFANVSEVFDIGARTNDVVVGDTCVIEAVTREGEEIDGSELAFASSDAAVASVDDMGVVTANRAGSADITVTYRGETLKSIVNVPNEPDSIAFTTSSDVIGVSETYTGLQVQMMPSGTDASVTWRSSNEKYVKVDENGAIKGVKKGSAYIYAKTRNGKEARCKVTVKKAPSKVAISKKKLTLGAGQTEALTAKLPSGSASAEIDWISADTAVATVDEHGNITARSAGKVKITARTYNNKTAACTVTVKAAPTAVTLSSAELNLTVKGTAKLKATLSPAGAMEENTFSSSNAAVATVSAAGKVKAKKVGTAVITLKTYNGVTATCKVNVRATPTKVKLEASALSLAAGMTHALAATVLPEGADPTLEWASSNTGVAKVENGVITALKAGTAIVACKTSNGKIAKCKVTVKAAPTSVALNPTALRLSAGGMSFRLVSTVKPSGIIDGAVTYASSNTSVAKVGADGTVTTVNAGTANITATTYNGKTASCAVTVTPKPAKAAFAQTSVSIGLKQSYTPDVSVLAADGSEAYADLTFKAVSNSGVIKIDPETGEITGVKTGTAVVNVVTHNSVTAATPLTVNVVAAATGVKLNVSSGTLGVGETYTLKSTLKGPEGCISALTWKSTNDGVASVTPGPNGECVVTGRKAGTATVGVIIENGKYATCKITVKKAPSKVALKVSDSTVYLGAVVSCTVSRPSGSGGSYTIESSNEAVLAKTADAKFTAVGTGTATLTVTTYNGKSASVKVTVKNPNPALSASDSAKIEAVVSLALSQRGKRYVYGAGYDSSNPSGFDCSGFTYWCYYYGAGITLGNSAYRQGNDTRFTHITGWQNLRRGDILCFRSDKSSTISHVGLYLGEGKFIHASSSGKKVQYGYFNQGNSAGYWVRNLKWGYHVIGG